jgi:hypothetical protein
MFTPRPERRNYDQQHGDLEPNADDCLDPNAEADDGGDEPRTAVPTTERVHLRPPPTEERQKSEAFEDSNNVRSISSL